MKVEGEVQKDKSSDLSVSCSLRGGRKKQKLKLV